MDKLQQKLPEGDWLDLLMQHGHGEVFWLSFVHGGIKCHQERLIRFDCSACLCNTQSTRQWCPYYNDIHNTLIIKLR